MANGVIFSKSAANKVRSVVNSISMPGTSYGGLTYGPVKYPMEMPLDLEVRNVEVNGAIERHVCVSISTLFVRDGLGNVDIDTFDGRNVGLSIAMGDNDVYWDLGRIENYHTTGSATTLSFWVYLGVFLEGDPVERKIRWGIGFGRTQSEVNASMPTVNPSGTTAGTCITMMSMIFMGAVVILPDDSTVITQGYHGNMLIPTFVEQQVVTDVQYDVVNHQVQKKTRNILAVPGGIETGWTMVSGGQAELYP